MLDVGRGYDGRENLVFVRGEGACGAERPGQAGTVLIVVRSGGSSAPSLAAGHLQHLRTDGWKNRALLRSRLC